MDALLFELAGARYALATAYVREVIRAVLVEPLPQAPPVIAGVINYRGSIIAVIDMRRRLGLASRPVAPEDHFLVVEALGRCLALHVDLPLELAELSPVPIAELCALPVPAGASYIAAAVPTDEGVILIHDLPAFLSQDEVVSLDRALAGAQAGCGV